MKIAELQARQGKVELTAKIIEKEEPRAFNKPGSEGQVCNAKLQDDSGIIKLTLWNEQVEQVKQGDTVKILNGYVGEWQGELQLSTGKFGQLEVVESGSEGDSSTVATPDPGFDEEEIE